MMWLGPLVNTRLARGIVGRIFSRRLRRLILVQISRAVASAAASSRLSIFLEIGQGIAKGGVAQPHEAGDEPFFEVFFRGVQIDRKIEEIGNERNGAAILGAAIGQEHIEAFEDENVRTIDGDALARHDVVGHMRIDRRLHIALAGFHIGDEGQELGAVVAFRKALFLQQALAFENRVRIQEIRPW